MKSKKFAGTSFQRKKTTFVQFAYFSNFFVIFAKKNWRFRRNVQGKRAPPAENQSETWKYQSENKDIVEAWRPGSADLARGAASQKRLKMGSPGPWGDPKPCKS